MRIVVAEDMMFTRAGIVSILTDAGLDVVAEAGDVESLHRAVRLTSPDLAIIDIRMPPTNTDEGLVAAERIRAEHPQIGVLVLSSYVEPGYALRLLEDHPDGAGYLLKERVFEGAVLIDALRRLMAGECVVDPTIVRQLVQRRRQPNPLDELTPREREVLSLLAEGHSNSAIARKLVLSDRTIETHARQVFHKLGLTAHADTHQRVLAVLAYLRTNS